MAEPTPEQQLPPEYVIESEEELDQCFQQLKEFLIKNDIDFKVNFRPKKMRAQTSEISGEGYLRGEVNIPQDFNITGRDNKNNPIDHGGDKVEANITDPNGNPVEANVVDNNDGTYKVEFTPLVPGDHPIDVRVNDVPMKEEPNKCIVSDEIPDATNCTVEGPGLETAEVRKPANFTIIARNRIGNQLKKGGVQFDVAVTAEKINAETAVNDNNDGTYPVVYTPHQFGLHNISVKVKDQDIKDTPKQVLVQCNQEEFTPVLSWAEGPGITDGGKNDSYLGSNFLIHGLKPNGEPLISDTIPFRVVILPAEEGEGAPKQPKEGSPEGAPESALPDHITLPESDIKPEITNNNDGTYAVKYCTGRPGPFDVNVVLVIPTALKTSPTLKIRPSSSTSFQAFHQRTLNVPALV